MTKLMELIDAYAEKADAWTLGELNPSVVDKHRAAARENTDEQGN